MWCWRIHSFFWVISCLNSLYLRKKWLYTSSGSCVYHGILVWFMFWLLDLGQWEMPFRNKTHVRLSRMGYMWWWNFCVSLNAWLHVPGTWKHLQGNAHGITRVRSAFLRSEDHSVSKILLHNTCLAVCWLYVRRQSSTAMWIHRNQTWFCSTHEGLSHKYHWLHVSGFCVLPWCNVLGYNFEVSGRWLPMFQSTYQTAKTTTEWILTSEEI
jgi:hypothetical protein